VAKKFLWGDARLERYILSFLKAPIFWAYSCDKDIDDKRVIKKSGSPNVIIRFIPPLV